MNAPSTESSGAMPSSYAPMLVRRALALRPDAPLPLSERVLAAVLFADISGFTPLTERIVARGPEGVEELSVLLDRWFGRLVEEVLGTGGDVLKFAGDGLLACWPADPADAAGQAEACARAATCALGIRRGLGRGEHIRDLTLSVKLTVGVGDLSWMILGGDAGQRELLVAGSPLRQVGEAQRLAGAGDAILSPEAWGSLGASCQGRPLPGGGLLLDSLEGRPPGNGVPMESADAPSALEAFVPAAVRGRLRAGQAGWLAELRPVSVVFVLLPELDEHTPPERAQRLVSELLRLCEAHEGTLNKLSVDDKGASALVVFGLPPLAHRDNPRRALEAAHAISASLAGQGQGHAVGVATGRVFCGTIGSARRLEYTVLGDVVNLAARLMQAAGERAGPMGSPILCDDPTARAAAGRLQGLGIRALGTIELKGKARPVPVHALDPAGERAHVGATTELVGREHERALMEDALDQLQEGRSRILILEGEAGIGKTRLLQHLRTRVLARALILLEGGRTRWSGREATPPGGRWPSSCWIGSRCPGQTGGQPCALPCKP